MFNILQKLVDTLGNLADFSLPEKKMRLMAPQTGKHTQTKALAHSPKPKMPENADWTLEEAVLLVHVYKHWKGKNES
ncbi:MAG: hypothetical protein LBT65_03445, partial [Synergistaceae bacterium]|nr:hypothetical protein [Synergistaceae bacterium]